MTITKRRKLKKHDYLCYDMQINKLNITSSSPAYLICLTNSMLLIYENGSLRRSGISTVEIYLMVVIDNWSTIVLAEFRKLVLGYLNRCIFVLQIQINSENLQGNKWTKLLPTGPLPLCDYMDQQADKMAMLYENSDLEPGCPIKMVCTPLIFVFCPFLFCNLCHKLHFIPSAACYEKNFLT